jgi:hypothetical protein
MVLLLSYTALRISDVCTLQKDAVSWDQGKSTWRVLVRTQKSGQQVFLSIPEHLKLTLDGLHYRVMLRRTALTTFGMATPPDPP